MKFIPIIPKKSLNKAFLNQRPNRDEIDLFKQNLIRLLGKVDEIEREENQKNHVRDFLRDTYYKETNEINTKGTIDLVIHLGKNNKENVGVICEAKRPSNVKEMFSAENPNAKGLWETILYYMEERISGNNNELKNLLITNVYEWYIIDANFFDKHIYRNSKIKKLFEVYKNDKKDTPFFYDEVSKIIPTIDAEIPCTYFDIRHYQKWLMNADKEDDKNLIALYKILSPYHLLKAKFADDSNTLDSQFYKELLHIIGLEEVKEGSKSIIRRKVDNRNEASLIESAIEQLRMVGLHKVIYGNATDEDYYNVALELCITWINRILFLKLLEGQLVSYHQGDTAYRFLNVEMVFDNDELSKLFHRVLAVDIPNRKSEIQEKYSRVPYLNSSLFEISELEEQTIKVNELDNSLLLDYISNTVLKDQKKKGDKLTTLNYFFQFLDAYDFASEGSSDIKEDSKTIINASVLGKVFEKINGYKDGSIFTPGFITMYMCRQTIRLAVVQKFKDTYGWNIEHFDDIKNYLADRRSTKDVLEFNALINSLRLCDPAVGSGHFLVSALNELIVIKYELGILIDEAGVRISGYEMDVINDELIVTDVVIIDPFKYTIVNEKPQSKEIQRLQKTLFNEKKTIIENCLFGVDINPNSVKICRLRLWIELLKSAYYREETGHASSLLELETLPNIDINIKCGNSLISRFALTDDLSVALDNSKYDVKQYREFVADYKNVRNRDAKRELQQVIDEIKTNFKTNIDDPFKKTISNARAKETNLKSEINRMEQWGEKVPKKLKEELETATKKLNGLKKQLEEIKSNAIYKNAFEWRFEFPEVLNDEGEFVGFDVVIGNPPYIRQEEIKEQKGYLKSNFCIYTGTADLYVFFVEKGFEIIKQDGYFSYIMPNKWMQAEYGKPLRTFLLGKQLQQIIDFGDLKVFDEATTYPCIINAAKSIQSKSIKTFEVETLNYDSSFEKYLSTIEQDIDIENFGNDTWVISSSEDIDLIAKLKTKGQSLSGYIGGKSFRGVLTGLSEAFIIDEATKQRLISEDENSALLIQPFLLGRNIKPYAYPEVENHLILVPKGFTIKRNLPSDNPNHLSEPMPRYGFMHPSDAWDWFRENFHALANYLLPFKEKAEVRTDQGDFWWELRACDYYEEFEMPKIMYQVFQVKPCFIFDDRGLFCNNSMWIIPKNDKFLYAILNSKLGWWLISKYCTAIQNGFQLIWKYFGQIPIANAIEDDKQTIQLLVDKILHKRKNHISNDISLLESEIDNLVYKLYDLSDEEIAIVEGK